MIYVIDDDKDLLDAVKPLLKKRGFNVSTFLDWQVAVNTIKQTRPHLILLDLFLSGIDGLAICKKLKASPYSKNIPILLFSAFPRIAESALNDYGAEDFIAKPFEMNELITKVRSIISKYTPA